MLSHDNELLNFGGSRYTFVCCVYSCLRLGELTGTDHARLGHCLGRIRPERQMVYAVHGATGTGYVALREDDTMLLYQKIAEKNPESSCQKHHKDL